MTIIATLYINYAQTSFEGMNNIVRFAFSVSGTSQVVYNKYQARPIKLVTRNTTFSVVTVATLNFISTFSIILRVGDHRGHH